MCTFATIKLYIYLLMHKLGLFGCIYFLCTDNDTCIWYVLYIVTSFMQTNSTSHSW